MPEHLSQYHSISRASIKEPGIAAKHPPAGESRVSFFPRSPERECAAPPLHQGHPCAPCLVCLENVLTPPTPPDLAEKLQPGFAGAHLSEIQKQKTGRRETQEQLPALLPQCVLGAPGKPLAKLWSTRMGHSLCPRPASLCICFGCCCILGPITSFLEEQWGDQKS